MHTVSLQLSIKNIRIYQTLRLNERLIKDNSNFIQRKPNKITIKLKCCILKLNTSFIDNPPDNI